MNAGDTFFIEDAFGGHLTCVLAVLSEGVVLVHFTTPHRRSDRSCVLQATEHSFIKHETIVEYSAAYICADGEQLDATHRMILRKYEPLAPAIYKRVFEGALRSNQTSDDVKNALKPAVHASRPGPSASEVPGKSAVPQDAA